jgi:hypothetical protein
MFDDSSPGLRIVGASAGQQLGKQQQRFHKLVKDAAKLKEAVRAWSLALPEIHRGVAELTRLQAEHRAVVSEIVRLFDRSFNDRTLTKRERAYLRTVVCDTALEVLEAEAAVGAAVTADVKEIYNRHSSGDFDTEAELDEAAKARMVRMMLEAELGLEFGPTDIRSLDELQQAAYAQMAEQKQEEARRAEEAAARKARRKKSAREVAAEARRDTEREQVGKALQDVYRKLAKELHPDREPDPEERARKTLLMQQINVAYEAKDLLQLLELQLRFEQLDEAQIGSLAEERLERYNRLLAEQVGQLKEELAGIEMPWRMRLGMPPTGKLPPARIQVRLRDDLRSAAEGIELARNDLQRFGEPSALKAWLAVELAAAQRRLRDRP